MRSKNEFDYSGDVRTPEPQRFNTHSLGCYTDPANASPHAACEEDDLVAVPSTQRPNHSARGHTDALTATQHTRDDADGPHTPPTVCRRSWLHLQAANDPFAVAQQHGGIYDLHERACEAFFPFSPTSLAPGEGEMLPREYRGGRSVSCPSANRSVAPARYSAGFNVTGCNGSLGRHTMLLGNTSAHTSHLQDTPASRLSVATSTAAMAASSAFAARATILLHATTPPGSRGEAHAGVGAGAYAHHHLQHSHHGEIASSRDLIAQAHVPSCGASVPRLARLSAGSGSGCSPGVRTTLGRPTTLRRPDLDLGVYEGWSDGGDDGDAVEDDPWIGGATQVWRNLPDLPQGSGALLPSCTAVSAEQSVLQDEERVTFPADARAGFAGPVRQQLFSSSSPPANWRAAQPPSMRARGCPDATLYRDEEHVSCEQNVNDDGDAHLLLGSAAVHNASFTGLEDAPRKSYIRTGENSPSQPEGKEKEKENACTADDETVSGRAPKKEEASKACVPGNASLHSGLTASDSYPFSGKLSGSSVSATTTTEHADPSQCNWLHGDSLTAQCGGDYYQGGATPLNRTAPPPAQQPQTGTAAATSAITADMVAAQLAHLSLHASPTQKRLAFEDEEDDEAEYGGQVARQRDGGSSDRHSTTTNVNNASASTTPVNATGCYRSYQATCAGSMVSSERRGAKVALGSSTTVASRGGRGGGGGAARGGCLSGLQLLRSRKRCLEEMQSTDVTVAPAPHHSIATHVAFTSGAMEAIDGVLADQTSQHQENLSQEEWKRQKREEQRTQRQRHLLPGDGSGDDLIPAPSRAASTVTAAAAPVSQSPRISPFSNVAFPPFNSQNANSQPPAGANQLDGVNWSQLSSISYVSPASQSVSTGMTGLLSYSSSSQREHAIAAVTCTSTSSSSQVLTSIPTNVAQRYTGGKQ